MGRHSGLNPQVVVLKQDHLGRTFVLLVKRSDAGVWTLPGGRREPGEDLATTARREVKEETGYNVSLVRPLGIYNLPRLPALGKVFVFVAEVTGGKPNNNNEISEVGWFVSDNLPPLLLPYHYQKIKDALAGEKEVEIDLPFTLLDIARHYWWTPITLFRTFSFYWFLARKNSPRSS